MVDYSKWDAMKFSDSESEGSDNDDDNGPRVTSLNQPGRVTIGADGSVQIGQSSSGSVTSQQKIQQQQQKDDDLDIPVVSGSTSGNEVDISSLPNTKADGDDRQQQQQQQQQQIQKRLDQLTRNGGKHTTTISTIQPPINLPVYWSQDRYAVTLRLGFPTNQFPSRTIRVKVVGALKYEDRHSAVGSGSMMTNYISKQNDGDNSSFGSVEIVSVSGSDQETGLFTGLLPRPIHLNQDEDEVEFEIENSGIAKDNNDVGEELYCDRFVSITMPKAVPMHGLVLWWDTVIIGFPKIDVSSIQDRSFGSEAKGSGISKDTAKKEAFQKAWNEAHEMFREKMKKKEKQAV